MYVHGEWWVRLSERLSMYFVVKNPCVPPQMHMRKYRNAVHDNWGNSTCGVSNLWVWHHCKIAIVPSVSLSNNFNHQVYPSGKVIYPKYSKHWPYTVALCSKMLNHGFNHGLFLSLFKLIPSHIHWIAYLCVSLFEFHVWVLKQF